MIFSISHIISSLEKNYQALIGIKRGIEREGIRINTNGSVSKTTHPKPFGSALTHKWITTDFSESLIEIVTPTSKNLNIVFSFLYDLHRYIIQNLNDERIWPMSIPCCSINSKEIKIAEYGKSYIGKMKMLYREGLKNRYGSLSQMISGIHYNFSFSNSFWSFFSNIKNFFVNERDLISLGYLRLIRSYYRFGWVIPYLFGASPAICSSFLKDSVENLVIKNISSKLVYFPYATSLRLSNFGYVSKHQDHIFVDFNHLDKYVFSLKEAMNTPFSKYKKIGLKKNNKYLQLNTNLLQIENELYTFIRPKQKICKNESLSDALIKKGIKYVEIRSLDINPFSPVGIEVEQIRFLDLFLIWCILIESPEISPEELRCIKINWNRVFLEGRKPNLTIDITYKNIQQKLRLFGQNLLKELKYLAKILDFVENNRDYQSVCDNLMKNFEKPETTLSARFLLKLFNCEYKELGLRLANKYHKILRSEPLEIFDKNQLDKEAKLSMDRQKKLESVNNVDFKSFF